MAACVLGGVLYGWALDSVGYGNSYYAAAARSMSRSWSNFFFGAFDPLGVSTVDKPPGALWVQALSVRLFGYHGWALILPQAVEGVLAIAVLHRAVLRWAGPAAASIAALVLALTPITVAVNRNDNPDTLLVLLLVCAAYAVTRAAVGDAWADPVPGGHAAGAGTSSGPVPGGRDRSRGWLVAAGALVGAAFTTKMLQAWVVAPALFGACLAAGPSLRRLGHAVAAGAATLVTSSAWVLAVDLWPGDKPYIGGSRDGSAWDLLIGYNGLGRVLGTRDGAGTGLGNAGPSMGGDPGWDRLFNDQVAGQISWLLPFCAVALVAAAVMTATRGRLTGPGEEGRRYGAAAAGAARSGWVLWGGWLVLCWAVFSFAEGIFHPYYTTQLGPAVAALSGAGAVTMWRLYLRPLGTAWALLPAAVGVTALWAFVLVRRTPDWAAWPAPAVGVTGALGVAGLLAGRFLLRASRRGALRVSTVAAVLAAVSVLTAPAAWSAAEPLDGPGSTGGVNPTAGPETGFGGGAGPGRGGGLPGRDRDGAGWAGRDPGAAGQNGTGTDGARSGTTGPRGTGQNGTGSSGSVQNRTDSSGTGQDGADAGGTGRAGPRDGGGAFPPPGRRGGAGDGLSTWGVATGTLTGAQRSVLEYATAHREDARILLATLSATGAAPYIVATGEDVIAMGGYNATDQAVDLPELRRLVAAGELRFVQLSGFTGQGADADPRLAWIGENCAAVELDGVSDLYRCGG
ncbi:glycosyltransferase family 39 protein [Streptosporangium fragile]|uniref:Glycosyltransferase family 39 protein n=1 Tax=Streptosporangium fragile TaxID=46186 RepID=A0ABN3VPK8_9ACTN